MKICFRPWPLCAGLIVLCSLLVSGCLSRNAAAAKEYYSIGMAYYELGKYAEAERWLNRARAADRTMTASEYNLGRVAFETGRYEAAAEHFEKILERDPGNVMALKGAAYSRIKNGDLLKAEAHYNRVLELVPESSDDGYNYALVLYALQKYGDCEKVLNRYGYVLDENNDALLLLARAQGAQEKAEAVDSYDKWLINNPSASAQGRYEYAAVLEKLGFYARALEQYRSSLGALSQDTASLTKAGIRFDIARVTLTADPGNSEGITELNAAVGAGFKDAQALESLLQDERITAEQREEVRKILEALNNPPAPSEGGAQGSAQSPQK
jgi:tetratricopeptide (TPR) repeat protein